MPCAFLTQDREKFFPGEIKARVRWNRLEDHDCDFVLIFSKRSPQQLDIVERQRNREIYKCCWNTSTARLAVGERATSRSHQKRIYVAVITTIELDDFVASRECAREANARHGRFRTTVHHPHFLDRRHPVAD